MRKVPARAEVDLIGVVLEDFFLGEALLEFEGDDDLGELAGPALVGIEPKHAGSCWLRVEAPCSLRPP